MPLALSQEDHIRLALRTKRASLVANGASGAGASGPVCNDLPTLPGVQSLSIATRYIDGGRERFIEYMQMAVLNELPNANKFWIVYADLLPTQRAKVSFDDVTAAAGVRPNELMAEIVSTAMEYGNDVGNLVAAALHPALIHQAGKSAKRIGGAFAEIAHKDRVMMLQARGFAPIPKGNIINLHASATAQAAAVTSADPSVPSFADDLGALAPGRKFVQHQLQSANPELAPLPLDMANLETVPVEAEFAHFDEDQ